ncbi:DUF5017 domain-containing protein [Sphingobacterium sp. SGG-5]|uniref:DUF5017 domain-containing protein n=1 Tax=Sphingobacterium sp. SGG-5 TaxID=2710881 RepID=UPI0013EC81D6|nr:DUF5017 domain-containing protein [Sphingobacterium sp. SGG-5]NGM62142.1 DUF5017 domain-containing protein [Sphingobacterium sp. SGG-5]
MKTYYLLILFCALMLSSCSKEANVDLPDFDVDVESLEVKANEEVTFHFSGSPDFINFYSGEWGNDYEFRAGRIEESDITLSFESLIINSRDATQDNQLAVLLSNNFNGELNISDVEAADWTDITDEFRVAHLSDENSTWIASGAGNISPYIEDGKPTYIAFRYTAMPRSTHGLIPNFLRVRSFLLESLSSNGEKSTLATHASAGITPPKELVKSATFAAGRSNLQATYLNFYGNISPSQDDVTHTAWAITNPLDIGKTVDFGIDKAVSVKTVEDGVIDAYTHTYSEAGTYHVVFEAKNANVYGEKTVIKQLEITVKP